MVKTPLQQLEHLGVKELQVTKNEATAVNPYHEASPDDKDVVKCMIALHREAIVALPPLPTSGIPDGRVSIEQVKEEPQWYDADFGIWILDDKTWSCEFGGETRTALVLKPMSSIEEAIEEIANEVVSYKSEDEDAIFKDGVELGLKMALGVHPNSDSVSIRLKQVKEEEQLNVEDMSIAETLKEIAAQEPVDNYLKNICKATDTFNGHELTLVHGNIRGFFSWLLTNYNIEPKGKHTSEYFVGRSKERFKELEAKGWYWRSFYNGWMEGRVDMYHAQKKQVKEEEPKAGFQYWDKDDVTNLQKIGKEISDEMREQLKPKADEAQEQTAEGIELLDYCKQVIAERYDCYNWQNLFLNSEMGAEGVPSKNFIWSELVETYADSALAQYKAKLIAELEADLKSKSHYVVHYKAGLNDAIHLIQTT